MEKQHSTIEQNDSVDLEKTVEGKNVKYYTKQPIDKIHQRYPYCIVWTPLPIISYIFPFIGHTGICSSDGKIHDFAGSYYISIDNMAFGEPHKYVFLGSEDLKSEEVWDESIIKADDRFRTEEHNLCCNNCHSHVAQALNNMRYDNKSNYNMFHVWWYCLANSKYVSWGHMIRTYLGFVIVILLILAFTNLN